MQGPLLGSSGTSPAWPNNPCPAPLRPTIRQRPIAHDNLRQRRQARRSKLQLEPQARRRCPDVKVSHRLCQEISDCVTECLRNVPSSAATHRRAAAGCHRLQRVVSLPTGYRSTTIAFSGTVFHITGCSIARSRLGCTSQTSFPSVKTN